MKKKKVHPIIAFFGAISHHLVVVGGAVTLTVAFFLVLPLMQTLTKPATKDLVVQQVDTAQLDAPPPPPEPEEEPEPEAEEEPPELNEEAPPLNLSQLEVALNPGGGGGWMGSQISPNIKGVALEKNDAGPLFSIADLDQKPRVVYQPGPNITKDISKMAPGTVYIIFVVDERGRVANPIIQKSSHPVFENAALSAVKKWKFEPGKRNGQPVRFRMRVPITFPKGV